MGASPHSGELCVYADMKVLGKCEGSWEASCQIKSAWRKPEAVGSYTPMGKPTNSEV